VVSGPLTVARGPFTTSQLVRHDTAARLSDDVVNASALPSPPTPGTAFGPLATSATQFVTFDWLY